MAERGASRRREGRRRRREESATTNAVLYRILTLVLIVAGCVCVFLGRPICTRMGVSGEYSAASEFLCDGGAFSVRDWETGRLRGQYFVVGASIAMFLVLLFFTVCRCLKKDVHLLEVVLIALVLLAALVCGILEAFYGAGLGERGRQRLPSGGYLSSSLTLIVVSYICASICYFAVFFLEIVDLCLSIRLRKW